MDIFLTGWWWGSWESESSTLWFQQIWGLHACGQHTVNFFLPTGGFSTCKTAPRTWLRILSIIFEEELKVLDFVEWLNDHYSVLPDCFPFSLLPHVSGSTDPLTVVFLQIKRQVQNMDWGLLWEGLTESCLVTAWVLEQGIKDSNSQVLGREISALWIPKSWL